MSFSGRPIVGTSLLTSTHFLSRPTLSVDHIIRINCRRRADVSSVLSLRAWEQAIWCAMHVFLENAAMINLRHLQRIQQEVIEWNFYHEILIRHNYLSFYVAIIIIINIITIIIITIINIITILIILLLILLSSLLLLFLLVLYYYYYYFFLSLLLLLSICLTWPFCSLLPPRELRVKRSLRKIRYVDFYSSPKQTYPTSLQNVLECTCSSFFFFLLVCPSVGISAAVRVGFRRFTESHRSCPIKCCSEVTCLANRLRLASKGLLLKNGFILALFCRVCGFGDRSVHQRPAWLVRVS